MSSGVGKNCLCEDGVVIVLRCACVVDEAKLVLVLLPNDPHGQCLRRPFFVAATRPFSCSLRVPWSLVDQRERGVADAGERCSFQALAEGPRTSSAGCWQAKLSCAQAG
eukprot:2089398-Amphidinium_carterae.2